jgi:subtilase family serine protease
MSRDGTRILHVCALVLGLTACASQGTLPHAAQSAGRTPLTARAIPITSPTPAPTPGVLGGLLSPVVTLATNLLPVCSIVNLSQAECGAIRNLNVTGLTSSLLGVISGYHPADLQKAYNLPSSSAGYGQTIGIVVAYDDPKAESDLAVYRSKFNLGACTGANGCFRKMPQSGAALPAADEGWGQETSVDLDMASAVCPHCRLLLVEASSSSVSDLVNAIQTAVSNGATVVSNSYAALEQPGLAAYDGALNHPGVPIVAGAGDSGFGVAWPASSAYVTAVGGTTLTTSLNARGFTERVWAASGSGCSAYIRKPSWQHDSGCAMRTVADVAAVADPNTGVAVYDTYVSSGGGWLEFGGTSVAAPIVAGAYALAGNGASLTGASSIYQHPAALFDVTSGSDGSCSPSYLCTAGPAYDGPSGLGAPNGVGAF